MSNLIFDKKNIVITGGAGFIGSHLLEGLIKDNKVICIDNLLTGDESNIDYFLQFPNFKFVNHDIIKPIDLENIPELDEFKISFQGIQEIYHLATASSPVAIDEHPVETSLANSIGVKNILDLAVNYKAKFLQASSSYVYGLTPPDMKFVSELYVGPYDHMTGRNSYIEGKKYAESLVKIYRDVYQLDAKIARIFNIYGPRMKMNDGREIPDLITKALAGEPLVIHGDETWQNSFCYVTDLVEALIKYMAIDDQGPINIGNPQSVAMVDVAKKIKALTNSTSEIVFAEFDRHAIKSIVPDITKIKDKIGWFPITLLDTGLNTMVKYIQATEHILGYYSR